MAATHCRETEKRWMKGKLHLLCFLKKLVMETLAQKGVMRDINMGCDVQLPMNIKHVKQHAQNKQ